MIWIEIKAIQPSLTEKKPELITKQECTDLNFKLLSFLQLLISPEHHSEKKIKFKYPFFA